MRDAHEIRARCSDLLTSMLVRPGMFGRGQALEMTLRAQMLDLSFIDGREDRFLDAELERDGLWTPLGAWGVLGATLGDDDYVYALAAIYAELASRVGYFRPARRLSPSEWRAATADVIEWARSKPLARADVVSRLGQPSYRSLRDDPPVLAYAGAEEDPWLMFSLTADAAGGLQWLRLPVRPFESACLDVRAAKEIGPEDAYRRFLLSTLRGDEREIREHLRPGHDAAILWEGAYPDDVARLLGAQYESMSVVRVAAPADVVHLVSDGCPVPLAMTKIGGRWLVDPEPLVRLRRRPATGPPTTPAQTATRPKRTARRSGRRAR